MIWYQVLGRQDWIGSRSSTHSFEEPSKGLSG